MVLEVKKKMQPCTSSNPDFEERRAVNIDLRGNTALSSDYLFRQNLFKFRITNLPQIFTFKNKVIN